MSPLKLWETRDRSELVRHGDRRAAFLFCAPGQKIPAPSIGRFRNAEEFFPAVASPAPGVKQAPAPAEPEDDPRPTKNRR